MRIITPEAVLHTIIILTIGWAVGSVMACFVTWSCFNKAVCEAYFDQTQDYLACRKMDFFQVAEMFKNQYSTNR